MGPGPTLAAGAPGRRLPNPRLDATRTRLAATFIAKRQAVGSSPLDS